MKDNLKKNNSNMYYVCIIYETFSYSYIVKNLSVAISNPMSISSKCLNYKYYY